MGFQNLTGQTLGQYELRELLGVGGMGAVYRGYQANLKRYVAVKVISGELAQQPGYLERFTREAETSAVLEHPHIIHIIDYGIQQGSSYLVMQMLSGGTLAERIAQRADTANPLPSLGEVADLLRQIGSALDYAHSEGVVHRDIKPSNVMFDNHGQAYLVDFGIAKLAAETQALTASGMVIGTWGYMAPEQWRNENLTAATDQYALGIMTYALVTGQMPFEAQTPAGVMHKHLNEKPAPPHAHRPDVPDALTDVIERALAKQLGDRFPTCTTFAQAFDGAIRGNTGPTTAYFTAPLPRKKVVPSSVTSSSGASPLLGPVTAERPIYKHPLTWLFVAVILVLAGALLLTMLGGESEKETAVTELARATKTTTMTTESVVVLVPSSTPAPTVTETRAPTATQTPAPNDTVSAIVIMPSETDAPVPTDTATAIPSPSDTPTPDEQATLQAEMALLQTQTAGAWTATPTDTLTPTSTPTATLTSAATFTRERTGTPIPMPTLTPTATANHTLTSIATRSSTPALAALEPKMRISGVCNSRSGEVALTITNISDTGTMARITQLAAGRLVAAETLTLGPGESGALSSVPLTEGDMPFRVEVEHPDYPNYPRAMYETDDCFAPSAAVTSVAFDSLTITTANAGSVTELQRLATGIAGGVAWSPDGNTLAVTTAFDIWLYNIEDTTTFRRIEWRDSPHLSFTVAAWSPDGALLAFGSSDRTVRVWDIAAWTGLVVLPPCTDEPTGVAWSPDGKLLASGTRGGTACLWDARTGTKLAVLEVHAFPYDMGFSNEMRSVVWSPDGARLASANFDNTVSLWDATTGAELAVLEGNAMKYLNSVAWSPDGARLASGGSDRTVHVWDAVTGTDLAVLEGHMGDVNSVAWSPDGALLASASDDHSVRLWDPGTATQLAVLEGTGRVESVAWSPNGNLLASGARDGVALWGLPGALSTGDTQPAAVTSNSLDMAEAFSGGNDDWTPVVQEFDGVEMMLVPVGCFEMGGTQNNDEHPVHRVCFDKPFWIDRTEVTNGQFAVFNGQAAESSYFSEDDRPRERITWTEAQAFCESRGARLPTEAEWEYAARGPEGWEYPWGDTWDQSRVIGYRDLSEGTANVGSLLDGASWVGALDMSGNVWEWVADWYGETYYASLTDGVINPTGPATGEYRVLRGGSWYDLNSDYFRAAYRIYWDPGDWNSYFGFRCVRSR